MLKRLELVGFKSFAHKTTLDFPQGISVIVGPNGSGKSNVIDALRWIIGERESKNLRGAKAEDLIFSGTGQKTRLGQAQASVYFDNSTQFFPVEYNDVVITRKVARDGEGQFLINKSEVRLKDVVDFFAQSHTGVRGLTIINQGNSDLFVRATPKERREMMEEVLGLKQYQMKKHEASLKLKATQENLATAQIAANEILPHLKMLRRQKSRWEQSETWLTELREAENHYFGHKINLLKNQEIDFGQQMSALNERLDLKNKELMALEKELEKIEQQSGNWHNQNSPLQNDKKYQLQKDLGRLEAQLELPAPKKEAHYDVTILLKLVKEIKAMLHAGTSAKEIELHIDSALKNQETPNEPASVNKKEILEKIERIKNELEKIEISEKEALEELGDFNKKIRQHYQVHTVKKEERGALEGQKAQLLLHKERWQWQWQELSNKLAAANRKPDEIQLISAQANLDDLERRINKLKHDLALVGEVDQKIVEEANKAEERYQFLSTQITELQSASADLEKLIRELDAKIKTSFNNYLGSVNVELEKYFNLLFRQGKAQLALAQTEESGESGVEIDISLPRKGVKGLNALSGGEKSLVSLAVLFSLIAITPPPFLVLDEVDAALDDVNSERFADLIKGFSHKTQFIVVTHNRSVMEAADALYGVTMGEDGVSKILSLKLT